MIFRTVCWVHHKSTMLKKKKKALNGVTCAKKKKKKNKIANLDFIPDLITVSAAPGNIILISQFGISDQAPVRRF